MRDLKNKLIGLTLLFVSGLFILKYMNVIEVSNTDIMLYGFFIVILTNSILNSYRKENRWLNISMTLVFIVILANQVLIGGRLFPGVGILPLAVTGLLFSYGIHFIFDKKDNVKTRHYYNSNYNNEHNEKTSSIEEEIVNIDSSLSSSTYYVTSKVLKKINARNNLGELKIYLNQEQLAKDATIDLSNHLGSTTIYISKDINVYCNIKGYLSSTNVDNVFNSNEYSQKIVVSGHNSLGSVDIVVI